MGVQGRIEQEQFKRKLLLSSRGRREHCAAARDQVATVGEGAAAKNATSLKLRSIEHIKVAKRRARKTTPAQLRRVTQSVRQYGIVAPVLIDAAGTVINGHIVVEAARELGISMIPVVEVTHLDEAAVRGLRIALNRLAETGEWELPELALELSELRALDFDLSDTGFTLPELDIIMLGDGGDTQRQSNQDALPAPAAEVVSQLGDVWQLGEHRIICGDATDGATYAALLGQERVHAVFGDPPFNVPIAGFVSGLGSTKHDDFVQGVGEWSDDEFTDFLQRYLLRCREVIVPGAAIFACMDWRSSHLLSAAAAAAGLTHANTCVWNKGSGGMGGLYRSTHELILVFCNGATVATNNVALGRHGRDRCNVWNYPGANRRGTSAAKALKLHATPKPVAMVEDALCDVSNRGDIVLDPFLGSGTTLIAAHATGRIGRFIELDPKFVDVAIRRFTELVGSEAVLAGTGQTFSEIAQARAERG